MLMTMRSLIEGERAMALVGAAAYDTAHHHPDAEVAKKAQAFYEFLVPLIKGAIEHKGAAFIDVVSPCVAFNNHAGSTKSYEYVRQHNEAVNRLDFIEGREEMTAEQIEINRKLMMIISFLLPTRSEITGMRKTAGSSA